MEGAVVVLDADENQRRDLCQLLRENGWASESAETLHELRRRIAGHDILAVIMDIDTVPMDNRTIRNLVTHNPGIRFFCLSERRFHPELEDAIGTHLYACINKPVDPDELIFWVRSIHKEREG